MLSRRWDSNRSPDPEIRRSTETSPTRPDPGPVRPGPEPGVWTMSAPRFEPFQFASQSSGRIPGSPGPIHAHGKKEFTRLIRQSNEGDLTKTERGADEATN